MRGGENQRADYLSERAAAGQITQTERDELLVMIYRSLWSLNDLDGHIESVHLRMCARCDYRRRSGLDGVISAIAGNKLPWIIILVLSLVIAALIGVDVQGVLASIK